MGSRLGVVFVELDLDTKRWDAAGKRILNDARTVTFDIEKNFKVLGLKSEAMFDMMRAQAINAYDGIKHSATSTANDIILAEKAKNAALRQIQSNQIAQTEGDYKRLGIQSLRSIESQKEAIRASFANITKNVEKGSSEWVRIEKAKNAKLKQLDNERLGQHEMNMASMMRSVLRFYSAYYVVSSGIQAVGRLFMGGVEAIDQMKISAVSVAAQITSMQGTTGDITENYRQNLEYARALVPVMMEIDAASFANLEQLQKMNMAMVGQGVILDANNKKQKDAFTAISNSIAMLTAGSSNPNVQAFTEMRALMSGELRQGAEVAKNLDAIIKKEGIYKNGLKDIVAEGKKHGDMLQRLEPYLVGIVEASGDVQNTWAAASSSLETAWTLLQTHVFKDFYKDIVNGVSNISDSIKKNTEEISYYIKATWDAVKYGSEAATVSWGIAALGASKYSLSVQGALAASKAFWKYQGGAATRAAGVFTGIFVGWEIGSWLNKEFENVRLMGIGLIDGLMKGWIEFKYGVQKLWLSMTGDWDVHIDNIESKFGDFLWKVGQGLDKVPFMDGAASAIKSYAQTLATASEHSEEYLKKEKEINDEKTNSLKIHQLTIDKLVAEAGAVDNLNKKKVEAPNIGGSGGTDDEAQKYLDKIKKTTEELEWQISIIHETERVQLALNAARALGANADEVSKQKIYDLTLGLYDLKKAQEEAKQAQGEIKKIIEDSRTPYEKFLFRMKELNILLSKGLPAGAFMSEYKKALSEMNKETDKAAEEIEDIWENTRNAIQDSIKGFFDSASQGEFESFKDMLGDLGEYAGSIFTAKFSEQITAGLFDSEFTNGLADSFNKLFDTAFKADEIAAGILGTLSAGISAAQSGNSYQMGGVALGAGIGAMFGPMGMAAGASIGGGLGGLFGGDDTPSYFSVLTTAIEDLTEQLKKNVQALQDQFLGTSEMTVALRNVQTSILNDSVSGLDGSLIEELNLPGGMKKRKAGFNAPTATIGGLGISGIENLVEGIGKGYTAFDMSAERLKETFEKLFGTFEIGEEKTLDIASAILLFSGSANDAGVLIDKLSTEGLLPDLPQRILDWYSDKGGSKNIEKVSEGITASLQEALYSVLVIAQSTSDSITSYMDDYDASKLTEYQKAIKDVDDTMGEYKDSAADQIPVLQSIIDKGPEMIAAGLLTEDGLAKAVKNLSDLTLASDEYDLVIKETIKKFKELRGETLASMRLDMGVDGQGNALSTLAITMMGIDATTQSYIDTLEDQGMSSANAAKYGEAYSATMKKIAWQESVGADITTARIALLTAQGNSEKALGLQRQAELKGIEALYGAGTPATTMLQGLAKQLWAVEAAAEAAAAAASLSAIETTTATAITSAGLTGAAKEIFDLGATWDTTYKEQYKAQVTAGFMTDAEFKTWWKASGQTDLWKLQIAAIKESYDTDDTITAATTTDTTTTDYTDQLKDMKAAYIETLAGGTDYEKQIRAINKSYNDDLLDIAEMSTGNSVLAAELVTLAEQVRDLQLAEAVADMVDAALSAYQTALRTSIQTEITRLEEAQAVLSENFTTAEDDYKTALQAKIDAENDAMQSRKEAISDSITSIQDLISETESLIDTFGSAVDSIRDYRSDLLTTDSLIGIESRYKTAQEEFNAGIAGMYSSDSTVAAEAIAKIPDLASALLDTSKGMGGIGGYQSDLARVLTVLNTAEGIAGVSKSNEERQLESLLAQQASMENAAASLSDHTSIYQTMLDEVTNGEAETRTFEQIQADYLDAKTAFDESTFETEIDYWEAELERLDALIDTSLSLGAAFVEYSTALTTAIGGGYDTSGSYQTAYAGLGNGGALASFAGGGTISGPSSGYTVPTKFHGTEHITTDNQMKEVAAVLTEVKGVLVQILNTTGDGNLTGKKVHRILDRVTQGGNTVKSIIENTSDDPVQTEAA